MLRRALVVLAVAGCAPASTEAPESHFWQRMSALCGSAHAGRLVEAPVGDTSFAGKDLVMHVRHCEDSLIRVQFHVGADRSRTWVLTRTAQGIRLKHDHRHADGTEDSVSQYGGESRAETTVADGLEFPADSFTAALIPPAATNVWTMIVVPGTRFVYALRREGTDRRFRVEFDLTRTVSAPTAESLPVH
jgi:hypothetical protein